MNLNFILGVLGRQLRKSVRDKNWLFFFLTKEDPSLSCTGNRLFGEQKRM